MEVNKNLTLFLDESFYLIDIVQSRLNEPKFKSWGKIIVVKRYIESVAAQDLSLYPSPSDQLPGINYYVWDLNKDLLLRDKLKFYIDNLYPDVLPTIFTYCEVSHSKLTKVPRLNQIQSMQFDVKVKLNLIERQIEKVLLKKNVGVMFYINNSSIDAIADNLSISTTDVKYILSSFKNNNTLTHDFEIPKNLTYQHIILKNADVLFKFFSSGYSTMSLTNMFRDVCELRPEFLQIPRRYFEKFLKTNLGLKFAKTERIKKDVDSPGLKQIRKQVATLMFVLLGLKRLVLFFDESLISEASFKNKVWKLKGQKYIPIKNAPMSGTLNILFITSIDRIWNFWICNKVNQHVITSFLEETLIKIRAELGQIDVYILLDNCPSHKTNLMKNFSETYKVFLVYNAPYSAKINPAEYFFEIIKRNFRHRIEKNYHENLLKTLHETIMNLNLNQFKACYHRAFNSMADCINMHNMWL